MTDKLAIVGSREMTLAQAKEARDLIFRLLEEHQPRVLISGGADGVDKIAAACARARRIRVEEKLPLEMALWAFRERNSEIAKACDYCVCIRTPQSVTQGSSWTMLYARDLKKGTKMIWLKHPGRNDPKLTKVPNREYSLFEEGSQSA